MVYFITCAQFSTNFPHSIFSTPIFAFYDVDDGKTRNTLYGTIEKRHNMDDMKNELKNNDYRTDDTEREESHKRCKR